MEKILKIALITSIFVVCTGCGNNKVENDNFNNPPSKEDSVDNRNENFNIQDELNDGENNYVEGITEPVIIEEKDNELRINVKGNVTSIYKYSGDVVTDWYEKYYFDTKEAAQGFVEEQNDSLKVYIKDNIVVVDVGVPEGIVMTKSDLLKTYSGLKEVYENEQ